MAGIYESFGYQLTISTIPNPDDPRVVIIVPNSSCRIEGTVTLAEALPVFKLQNITATGCPTDANVTAIGLFSKLYGGHGILNLAITSDNKLPKYWVKY